MQMRRTWIICSLLAAVTLAVYWPVRHNDFVCYDDPLVVTQNFQVQSGLTPQSVRYALTANLDGEWMPITLLSHTVDCEFFGFSAGLHHLVSVAFHLADALLLFLVLGRMTGATWRSAIVAALFALHPLRVESVAWIAERKDVLSGFFFMLTLWAYVRYVQSPKSKVQGPESEVQSPKPGDSHHVSGLRFQVSRFYLLSLLFFALGLMSKPMLVTLPFVLLLLDYWPLQRLRLQPPDSRPQTPDSRLKTLLRLAWEKWRFFALSALFCGIATFAMKAKGNVSSLGQIGLMDRVTNAIVSYVAYLGKMFWPTDLAVIYPHPGPALPGLGTVAGLGDCRGGAVAAGPFRPLYLPASAPALPRRWLVLVPGDDGAGDWFRPGGGAGDGGPLHLHTVDRSGHQPGVVGCRGGSGRLPRWCQRALGAGTSRQGRTPHPGPLPFGRGEGESSPSYWRTEVQG